MVERRASRQRAPSRSRLGLIRLLLALDIIALGLVVYDAPTFKVARIRVGGTQTITPVEVANAAVVRGENLLSLDLAAKARAVERLHRVKSAVVQRRLPNEVVIRVVERRPTAIWVTSGGRFLVDDEGVVLGEGQTGESLVTVTDLSAGGLAPGSRLAVGVVAQAQQLWQSLPPIGVVLRQLVYDGNGLTVVTDRGWKARFGGPESVAYKVAVLKELIPIVSRQRFELIDLQSADRPYIR